MRFVLFFSVLALVFVNGWTDAPNAIAGVVATGGMRYRSAAWMAAGCNIAGALAFSLFGGQVAKTVLGLADFSRLGFQGLCALAGCFLAVVLFAAAAWLWGIPTSESHGLMAGILGSGLALGQTGIFRWRDWQPVLAGLFLSLGLGFLLGLVLYRLAGSFLQNLCPRRINRWQRAGAAANALMHGGQDGQKFAVMLQLVWAALAASPAGTEKPQAAAVFFCAAAMGLGTLCGGRRIIQKTAVEMVQIDPSQSIAADLASAGALLSLSLMGLPVSTTHTKTTAIMGVGAAKRLSSVNWGVVREMVMTWVLTFPGCGLIGFLMAKLFIAVF